MPNTIAPFGHPLYVMLKPVGAACNLRCEYCYYLEKQNLYDKAERHVMTEEMLERFTREYIEAQTMPQVLFTWHGGEPLMRPLSFYKKALELQRKYARDKYGNPGLNYLCEGYHKFLEHVTPYMDFMKRELDNQRPPANIMEAVRKGCFR